MRLKDSFSIWEKLVIRDQKIEVSTNRNLVSNSTSLVKAHDDYIDQDPRGNDLDWKTP